MNELKAPYAGQPPSPTDADQPATGGFRIVKCGFDGCGWQSVEAGDPEAFRHLVTDHGDALQTARQLAAAEVAP